MQMQMQMVVQMLDAGKTEANVDLDVVVDDTARKKTTSTLLASVSVLVKMKRELKLKGSKDGMRRCYHYRHWS